MIQSSAPSYLRIHPGTTPDNHTELSDATRGSLTRDDRKMTSLVEGFWDAFQVATGWQLAPRSRRIGGLPVLIPAVNADATTPANLQRAPATDLPGGGADPPLDDFLSESLESLTRLSAVGKADATTMAAAAMELISDLGEANQAISRQHAELAARANVVVGQASQTDLAMRLAEILSDASQACGCQAAAMYLLDDDTSQLQIRSVHRLPASRLTAGPRPLQGARGDLEAMVKDVVLINDLRSGPLDTWNAPEEAAAAICAVISTADLPIGTLWLFAKESRSFGPAETAAARMAARWIQAELAVADDTRWPTAARAAPASRSPEISTPGGTGSGTAGQTGTPGEAQTGTPGEAQTGTPGEAQTGTPRDVQTGTLRKQEICDVAQWQYQALPVGSEIAKDWKVDGLIESPNDFATGWHAWDILPDGTIALAIAEAVASDITGAMNATVARAALAAHSGYRHTPAQILSRIGDTLWQTSLGEQLMSMMYIQVHPESGEGELASAGLITAMIASRFGYRPVVSSQTDPLCSHIDTRCVQETFRLSSGEALLAYTPGIAIPSMTHTQIGGLLHDAMKDHHPSPLAALRRKLADMPLARERGASVITRG